MCRGIGQFGVLANEFTTKKRFMWQKGQLILSKIQTYLTHGQQTTFENSLEKEGIDNN